MVDFANFSDDELLLALKEEREKFTKSDKDIMLAMVEALVERGVYQDTPQTLRYKEDAEAEDAKEYQLKNRFLRMVEGWGEDWHKYREPLNCPHCDADLRSEEGPPFKREIGIYMYDRTAYYKCPDCGQLFNRFPKGHPYHMAHIPF